MLYALLNMQCRPQRTQFQEPLNKKKKNVEKIQSCLNFCCSSEDAKHQCLRDCVAEDVYPWFGIWFP